MRVFRRIMLGSRIDIESLPDTQKLYYKATAKVSPQSGRLGSPIIKNSWDSSTGEGIIVCSKDISGIGNYAFMGETSLTSITIPDGVTSIGDGTFQRCSNLTSITIPDSVMVIGGDVFRDCTRLPTIDGIRYADTYLVKALDNKLTECTIKDTTRFIGTTAFEDCKSLASVTIPDGVTSIGIRAFMGCSNLTSITIPDSVTSMGFYVFRNCTRLTSVYCKATTPPVGGTDMFYNNASGRKIYVPMESVEAYKSATLWSTYASAIEGYEF